MALRSKGASDPNSDGLLGANEAQRPIRLEPTRPYRTCIGCRQRSVDTELLRIVVASGQSPLAVIPDPRRRAPGRGAWLHPVTECVDLAERRRAFARALLRRPELIDVSAVREYLAASNPGTE